MRTGLVRSLMVGLLALTLGIPAARGAVVLEKKLTSISVSGKDSVAAGGKLTLTATAKYDDGSSSKVTPTKCTSSNTGIATVSNPGVVTGIKIGSASITDFDACADRDAAVKAIVDAGGRFAVEGDRVIIK